MWLFNTHPLDDICKKKITIKSMSFSNVKIVCFVYKFTRNHLYRFFSSA